MCMAFAHTFVCVYGAATLVSVTVTCALAVVGYAVLLRDLLEPLYSRFTNTTPHITPWTAPIGGNILMICVALTVTPLMFLDTLTALKPMGMVSCTTIFLLALSIAIRNSTCLSESPDFSFVDTNAAPDFVPPPATGPDSLPVRDTMWKWLFPAGDYQGIINSLPILICTYVCHFNVLPVHHELHKPSRRRLKQLIHTTFLVTAGFYFFVGTFGMLVGNCPYYVLSDPHDANSTLVPQAVQGNILKNFPDDDNIITVGRIGLSCTITLAFPLLVVPCRDIVLRVLGVTLSADAKAETLIKSKSSTSLLGAPLLSASMSSDYAGTTPVKTQTNLKQKLISTGVTLTVFWGGLLLACFVEDIEVVWDLLGSSISIFIAFIVRARAKRAYRVAELNLDELNLDESLKPRRPMHAERPVQTQFASQLRFRRPLQPVAFADRFCQSVSPVAFAGRFSRSLSLSRSTRTHSRLDPLPSEPRVRSKRPPLSTPPSSFVHTCVWQPSLTLASLAGTRSLLHRHQRPAHQEKGEEGAAAPREREAGEGDIEAGAGDQEDYAQRR